MRVIFSRLDKKLALILIIAFILGLIYFNPNLHIEGDNARYLIVAKSILAGTGYRITSFHKPKVETMHPFGYSFILAFIMALFGENLIFLKLLSLLSFVFFIWLAFEVFSKDISQQNLFFLILIMALSPFLTRYSDMISTEAPYLFISFLAFLMFKKYLDDKSYFAPLVAALILTFYIRAQGIVILGAIIFYHLLKKNFKDAIIMSGISMLIVSPWIIWKTIHRLSSMPVSTDYMGVFFLRNLYHPEMGSETILGICFRIYRRIKFYSLAAVPTIIFPCFGPGASLYNLEISKSMLGVFILIMALVGYAKKFVLKLSIVELYFLGYCGILLVWSWYEIRFLATIFPIILFYFIFGLEHIFRYKKGIIATGIIALLVFSNVIGNVKTYNQRKEYPPEYWKGCNDIARWVKENTPEWSLISCRKPYLFHYFTGRKTFDYKYTKDTDKMLNDFEESKVNFILLNLNDNLDNIYLKPAIEKYPSRFELAFKSRKGEKETFLYRFKK